MNFFHIYIFDVDVLFEMVGVEANCSSPSKGIHSQHIE